MAHVDEAGHLMLVEGVSETMSEPVFEGRTRSGAEHLRNVQAVCVGAHRLLERACTGNPYEADSNVSCAANWLRAAAAELEELLKAQR